MTDAIREKAIEAAARAHDNALTRDHINAILAGCEGVTPGPWRKGNVIVGTKGPSGFVRHLFENCWPKTSQGEKDLSHIARLDPDTIRDLCRLALIGLDAETRVASAETAVRNAALEEAAKVATSLLMGDPPRIPFRSPMAHEIAAAIRAMKEPT